MLFSDVLRYQDPRVLSCDGWIIGYFLYVLILWIFFFMLWLFMMVNIVVQAICSFRLSSLLPLRVWFCGTWFVGATEPAIDISWPILPGVGTGILLRLTSPSFLALCLNYPCRTSHDLAWLHNITYHYLGSCRLDCVVQLARPKPTVSF